MRERRGDVLRREDQPRAAAHLAVASGVSTTVSDRRFGYAMPPGDHGEPAGMPGTVATLLPCATNPSRNASWNGPQEPELPAAARHLDRHAALVERDEEAAEAVVERVDVVEQTEDVGLAPGQDLAADAQEERPLLEVEVGEEEAVALAGVAAQPVDALLDVLGRAFVSC